MWMPKVPTDTAVDSLAHPPDHAAPDAMGLPVAHAVSENITLRAGVAADASRLAVLATQVWLHTYATDGVSGEIAQYVLAELTPEKFATALGAPSSAFLVAERGACLLGYAALQFDAPCPSLAGPVVELQTLYVQAHSLGQGVGWALLQAAQRLARQRSDSVLWLTVNAQNARARAFYARQGYAQVGSSNFQLGHSRHENHVLVGTCA